MNTDITYPQKRLITILLCILAAVMAYRLFIQPDIEKSKLLSTEYDTAIMSRNLLEQDIENADNSEYLLNAEKDFEAVKDDVFQLMPTDEISLAVCGFFSDCNISPQSMTIGDVSDFNFGADAQDGDIVTSIRFSEVSVSFESTSAQLENLIRLIDASSSLCISDFELSRKTDNVISAKITLDVYMYVKD